MVIWIYLFYVLNGKAVQSIWLNNSEWCDSFIFKIACVIPIYRCSDKLVTLIFVLLFGLVWKYKFPKWSRIWVFFLHFLQNFWRLPFVGALHMKILCSKNNLSAVFNTPYFYAAMNKRRMSKDNYQIIWLSWITPLLNVQKMSLFVHRQELSLFFW